MIHNMMIAAATTDEVSRLCGGGNVYVFAIIVLLVAIVFAVLRIAMSVSKLPTEQSLQNLNDSVIAEEVIRALAGTAGLLLTIPLTALFGTLMMSGRSVQSGEG